MTPSTATPASTSSKPTSASPRASSPAASSDSWRTVCSNAGPTATTPSRDRYEGRPGPSNSARRSRQSRTTRILERVRAIPRGSVRTYSEIDPEAPRVVGRVLATTHEKVPWHRVVRADGSAPLGADQLALLRKERVPLHGDRVDLGRAKRSRPGVVQEGAGRVSGEPHRNRDAALGK